MILREDNHMKKRNRIKNKIKNGVFGCALIALIIESVAMEKTPTVATVIILISLAIIVWYCVANGYFN